MRAVSDSGPIIHLSWVGRLDLLDRLFDEILVPAAVRDEVFAAGNNSAGVTAMQSAFATRQLTVQTVMSRESVDALEDGLHRGEAEAIVLMEETRFDLLLVDDRQARRAAESRGLPISGTIGILRMARERRLIQKAAPILGELQQLGFRISPELIREVEREEQ